MFIGCHFFDVLFGNTMLHCFLCCCRLFFLTARCRLCTGCSSLLFSCVRSDVNLKNGFKQGNPIKGISKSFPLWTKGTRSVTVVNATYRKSRKSPPRTKFRRGVDFLADKRSKKIRCSSALIGMYIPTVVLTFSMTLTRQIVMIKSTNLTFGNHFVFRGTGVGVRGSTVPRYNPLPFYIPISTEKVLLSYTFNWKWCPFLTLTVGLLFIIPNTPTRKSPTLSYLSSFGWSLSI